MKCPKCKIDGWIALHELNSGTMCWRCAADEIAFNGGYKIEK